jgi:uncharacterized protein YkwD
VFDPVRQFEDDVASVRRRRHAARRGRAAIYLGTALLAAMTTLLALLVMHGMAHESARPVADPATASTSAAPSTSDGGVARQAQADAPSSSSVAPSPTGKPAPASSATRPASAANASYENQVVTLTNQERAKAGCPALTVDSRLTAAARGHSQDMATRNYFDHNTPEGVTPWTRITNAGYHYTSAAENIAEGQPTPDAVMTAWMNSTGHRENILNCKLRNIGVGLAYNAKHTPYWTQDFGSM